MPEQSSQFILSKKEIIADPYGYYDDLRAKSPVCEIASGVYFLSRYPDCAAALIDRRLSNRPAPFALLHKRHQADFIGADIAQNLIAFRDAPDVKFARKSLATEFMAFTKSRAPVLAELAKESVAGLDSVQTADFVSDVALPFAVHSMCRIMGFPEADAARLKAWSADFFYLFHAIPDRETLVRLNAQLAEFRSYTREILQARRAAPKDDLISQLAKIDAGILDETALVDNIMLFAADGVENVWAGMANALAIVVKHHDLIESLLARGVSWGAVLTECLRLESPGQYQGRVALEPLEIGGVSLRKYSVVLVGLAAANRDPDTFEDPSAFRPDRKGARDLSFGLGPHACLGRSLVNMQMIALFEALTPYLGKITCKLDPGMWDGRAGHRWLSTLPIEL